jgi:two-component system sensor histidine kinase TctE
VAIKLRTRLLLFLIPPLVFIMMASTVAQYFLSVRQAGSAFDQALNDAAVALSQEVEIDHGRGSLALSEETARLLRSDSIDDIYFSVRGPKGEWIAGDEGLPPFGGAVPANRSRFYDDKVYERNVRVAAISTSCGAGRCQIQVAQTLNKRRKLANDIVLGTLLPQLVAGAVVIAIIWFGVGRALGPLERLCGIIDRRSPRDLGQIDVAAAPDEIRSLVTALNALFERLREAGAAQQRFISTAAHQLRTPLAGLKAAAELALLEPVSAGVRQRLEQIDHAAARASRLASQLLALARSVPEAHLVDPMAAVNLKQLVEDQIDEWMRMAIPKNIDLGFELSDAVITGEAVLLREMMRNLVHNALEYSPAKAKVTVRCGVRDGHCFLEVEDNGPGIAPAYREKAFEPFVRLPGTPGTGSGLGLAIAREVAAAHGAGIAIGNPAQGEGTLVRVSFA